MSRILQLMFCVSITLILGANVHAESGTLPRPEHIVIVIGENTSLGAVVGNPKAPFINSLANNGALFTNYVQIGTPSLPNYIGLFSGSTQGFPDNKCSRKSDRPNLYTSLHAANLTFIGYAEDLPSVGFAGCHTKGYQKKHTPWPHFTNVPGEVSHPLTDFPTDFTQLPTLAIVIPNRGHQEPLKKYDAFVQQNLAAYAEWAQTHNSLLIVTFDEGSGSKKIATIITGQLVKPGQYDQRLSHYNLLRTIEDMYGLPLLAKSATADPIADVFVTPAAGAEPPTDSEPEF